MSSYLQFLPLGLGAGAVYTLLALGLVLKYRTTQVVDFAHGAVAMFSAYVFVELRNHGDLIFPWVGLPHSVSVADQMPMALAFAITLVYSALLGLLLYVLIYKPLRHAPALARVGASVGVLISLQAIAVLNFSTYTTSTPPILPSEPVTVLGLNVPSDRLYLAAIAIVLGAVLAIVYKRTRFGLASRAAADNERGAELIGLSASRIGAQNWVLATLLATVAGVLILPITTLAPGTYTLFIIPALGVALIARFNSFAITVVAGLGLGMLQSELIKIQGVWTWLPQQGLQDGLPFLIIIIAMTLLARRLPARGSEMKMRNPSIGRPQRPVLTAALGGVVCLVALQFTDRVYGAALLLSLITFCICLSVVVVTGYVGQISLAQNAFAGIAAFEVTHLSDGLGIGFPFSLLIASSLAAAVGVAIGFPAVRIRGVNLAVITLAVALALDALVFNATSFTGGYDGRDVASPTLFGLDLGIQGSDYPRFIFGVLVVVVVMTVAAIVGRMRSGPAGRMFLAVRSNEHAAASVGIDVARTKLFAFGLAAFIAGVGGSLLAYQQTNVNPGGFVVWTSLTVLAITYVGGVGKISGALAAAFLLATGGLMPTLLDQIVDFGTYQSLIAGVLLVVTAITNPDGIVTEAERVLRSVVRRLRKSSGGGSPQTGSDGKRGVSPAEASR